MPRRLPTLRVPSLGARAILSAAVALLLAATALPAGPAKRGAGPATTGAVAPKASAAAVQATAAPGPDTAGARGPEATVQALFDAMARRDSAALRELLLPGARIAVPTRRDGAWTVDLSGTAEFIEAVTRTPGLEERMRRPEVRTDGRMATVWAEYAFYLDGRLRHCGVDAFQLFRLDGRWRIQHVAYTRRTEGCESWEES